MESGSGPGGRPSNAICRQLAITEKPLTWQGQGNMRIPALPCAPLPRALLESDIKLWVILWGRHRQSATLWYH
jgi:hypothetical protein